MSKRPSKYKAQPTVIDGIRFHSKAEARRYQELKLLERAGEIIDLRIQPSYDLCAWQNGNAPVVGVYRADFSYFDVRHRKGVVEDVKSPPTRTSLYRWKIKHLRMQYGIEVAEVYASTSNHPR